MKLLAQAIWTAFCLAFTECLVYIVLAEILYVAEGSFTTFSSHVEGVNAFSGIIRDGAIFLGGKIIYGFVPATAVSLLLCRAANHRLHWTTIGGINAIVFLIVCGLWESEFHLLHRFLFMTRPLYKNVMYIEPVVHFVSPLIVSKLRLWGSFLPAIQKAA